MSTKTIGFLLGLLGVIAFGLTLPASRLAVPELGALLVGPGRALLAAIPAALYLLLTKSPCPAQKYWPHFILMSAGVVIGFPLFSAMAMGAAPASHGGVMLGILPLTTALAAGLVAGEKPSLGFWVLNVLGAGAVIAFALRQGGFELHPADLWLLIAVVFASLGYAWGGVLSRDIDGAQVISWGVLIAVPVILPMLWLGEINLQTSLGQTSLWEASALAWGGYIYAALISQWAGFFAWYRAMALVGVARTGQVQLLQPFVTLLAAGFFLGEVIDLATFGFAVLVAVIVAFGQKMRIEHKQ